jgi:hypothetical protein
VARNAFSGQCPRDSFIDYCSRNRITEPGIGIVQALTFVHRASVLLERLQNVGRATFRISALTFLEPKSAYFYRDFLSKWFTPPLFLSQFALFQR